MLRVVMGLLLGAMILGFGAPPSEAQEDEPSPAAGEARRPHAPPPSWKSVEIGNYYLKRKKYNAALSRYQEAAKTDPYYAPAYLGLGKVYEKIGLKQKALDAYRKYLDLLPSMKDAEEARGVHKAIARLESALRRSGPRQAQTPQRKGGSPPP